MKEVRFVSPNRGRNAVVVALHLAQEPGQFGNGRHDALGDPQGEQCTDRHQPRERCRKKERDERHLPQHLAARARLYHGKGQIAGKIAPGHHQIVTQERCKGYAQGGKPPGGDHAIGLVDEVAAG